MKTRKSKHNVSQVNNFYNDPDLPDDIKGKLASKAKGTTSDVAAYKMLQNVTPEMMKDPEFVKQLNRFVGGNMASFIATEMPKHKDKTEKMVTFRENPLALVNAKILGDKYINQDLLNNVMDTPDTIDAYGKINDYMGTEQGKNMADLLGNISQGMNGQGFSGEERSQAVMNHMILRNVAPAFVSKIKSTDGDEKADYKRRFLDIQKVINLPEESRDAAYMRNFSNQLDRSGVTKQRDDYKMPSRGMGTTMQKPAVETKKKKWWQFWKK